MTIRTLSRARSKQLPFIHCLLLVMAMSLPALGQTGEGQSGETPSSQDEAGVTTDEAQAAKPVDEAQLAEARLHFSNGVELLQASPPNYQDAYRQFLLAYEKSAGNWKVLGNLALSALKLERDGEALEYYQAYLDQGGEEIDEAERQAIKQEVLLLRGNMATVRLEAQNAEVLRVTVERRGSSAPPQLYTLKEGAAEIGVRAGALTFTAQADGKTRTWEVVLSAGEETAHTFDFAEPKAEETTAPPPVLAATEPGDDTGAGPNGFATTGYVVGGVGVAGIIGGVVTGLMTRSKENEARQSAADICIDGVCPTSVRAQFDEAGTLATVTNVLFIAGGVLTATGVTLVLVGSGKNEREATPTARRQEAQVSIAPLLGPGTAGLFASGSF